MLMFFVLYERWAPRQTAAGLFVMYRHSTMNRGPRRFGPTSRQLARANSKESALQKPRGLWWRGTLNNPWGFGEGLYQPALCYYSRHENDASPVISTDCSSSEE